MPTADESAVQKLLDSLSDAWNRGDAKTYGAHYLADGTFTNVNGAFHAGREEFDRRHEDIFRGIFKGSTLSLMVKKLRFIRPDVAVVDIDVAIFGCKMQPPGVPVWADGALHTCLLMVLVAENGEWWIAAYHNVWNSTQH